jgi:hypothetical protein
MQNVEPADKGFDLRLAECGANGLALVITYDAADGGVEDGDRYRVDVCSKEGAPLLRWRDRVR